MRVTSKGTSKLSKCLTTRKSGAISLHVAIHSFNFPCNTRCFLCPCTWDGKKMIGFASTPCLQFLKQARPNVMCHLSKLLCCLWFVNHLGRNKPTHMVVASSFSSFDCFDDFGFWLFLQRRKANKPPPWPLRFALFKGMCFVCGKHTRDGEDPKWE